MSSLYTEIAVLAEPVTFFDVTEQGRIFRADERRLIEQHIAAARQHVELATNRNDLHRATYCASETADISGFFNPVTISVISGVRTFHAGRENLSTLPLAKLLILQLAIDSYDARAAATQVSYMLSPTFRLAVSALRMPASRPL